MFGAAVAATVGVAQHLHGSQRAVCLGLGAGLCYGVNSALTKTFAHLVPEGPIAVLTHWEPYAPRIATFVGLWPRESMFQGAEIGAGLPVNETVEPITASALGIALFHESINVGARGNLMLLCVAAIIAVACAGVSRKATPRTFTEQPPPRDPRESRSRAQGWRLRRAASSPGSGSTAGRRR